MRRQNRNKGDVNANEFSFVGAHMLIKMMALFIVFACGTAIAADRGWRDQDRPSQIKNAHISKNASRPGEGKRVAKPVTTAVNVPASAVNPTRNHAIAPIEQEEELSANTSRLWAVLLVAISLLSLRIRGSIDRPNKVY